MSEIQPNPTGIPSPTRWVERYASTADVPTIVAPIAGETTVSTFAVHSAPKIPATSERMVTHLGSGFMWNSCVREGEGGAGKCSANDARRFVERRVRLARAGEIGIAARGLEAEDPFDGADRGDDVLAAGFELRDPRIERGVVRLETFDARTGLLKAEAKRDRCAAENRRGEHEQLQPALERRLCRDGKLRGRAQRVVHGLPDNREVVEPRGHHGR